MRTRLTELARVKYPIVQTGMGYVAGAKLTAATANAGGLGIIASATMSLPQLEAAINEVKERTQAPFGVNLRADAEDANARIDLMIARGVKVASFALAPKQDMIKRLKDAGLIVIPSVGAKRHAEKVAQWGADAVIVQGGEGGGHTGAVPTSLLVPQVVDTVDIPVVAAGGFFDGRGLVAALAYGAVGIAMGTRFLLTSDSPVGEAVKALYLTKSLNDTVVTTNVDGVPHRVLRTAFVASLEKRKLIRAVRNGLKFRKISGLTMRQMVREGLAMRHGRDLTWSQILMAANTPMLLKAAMVDGRPDLGVMSAGQVVGVIDDLPSCAELIERIMTQAADRLGHLRDLASE
ncbi:NAD(P)H-dependent flavin oxidoreductase [Catelliglobosispora koreensis]|uniref:NAD(P)H-dependent flavin oxidoreductase n=1 Tax=Catelliglobosispora koreensis TaxID=129052 RepID=UPI0003A92A36|nr:nitronate monooxygenase [Catelliglobosispora koreensis]